MFQALDNERWIRRLSNGKAAFWIFLRKQISYLLVVNLQHRERHLVSLQTYIAQQKHCHQMLCITHWGMLRVKYTVYWATHVCMLCVNGLNVLNWPRYWLTLFLSLFSAIALNSSSQVIGTMPLIQRNVQVMSLYFDFSAWILCM